MLSLKVFWTNGISFLPALMVGPSEEGLSLHSHIWTVWACMGRAQGPENPEKCVQQWVRPEARAEGSPAHLTACGSVRCPGTHSRGMQTTPAQWAAHMDSKFWEAAGTEVWALSSGQRGRRLPSLAVQASGASIQTDPELTKDKSDCWRDDWPSARVAQSPWHPGKRRREV